MSLLIAMVTDAALFDVCLMCNNLKIVLKFSTVMLQFASSQCIIIKVEFRDKINLFYTSDQFGTPWRYIIYII